MLLIRHRGRLDSIDKDGCYNGVIAAPQNVRGFLLFQDWEYGTSGGCNSDGCSCMSVEDGGGSRGFRPWANLSPWIGRRVEDLLMYIKYAYCILLTFRFTPGMEPQGMVHLIMFPTFNSFYCATKSIN